MTTKKTKNVSPTKEEKDEALRAFMYGDIMGQGEIPVFSQIS